MTSWRPQNAFSASRSPLENRTTFAVEPRRAFRCGLAQRQRKQVFFAGRLHGLDGDGGGFRSALASSPRENRHQIGFEENQ